MLKIERVCADRQCQGHDRGPGERGLGDEQAGAAHEIPQHGEHEAVSGRMRGWTGTAAVKMPADAGRATPIAESRTTRGTAQLVGEDFRRGRRVLPRGESRVNQMPNEPLREERRRDCGSSNSRSPSDMRAIEASDGAIRAVRPPSAGIPAAATAALGGWPANAAGHVTLGFEAVQRLVDRSERLLTAGARLELPPDRNPIRIRTALEHAQHDELLEFTDAGTLAHHFLDDV